MYDIIVIGAGPAGATAARYAAEAGASVLLIDKQREIGSPVRCGGFIPHVDEISRLLPNAQELDDLFTYPRSVIENTTLWQRFVSPSGEAKDIPVRGNVVDRRRFDQQLAKRAIHAGADIELGLMATEVAPGRVKAGGREYRARVIIGADGPSSITARSMGLSGEPNDLDMAIGMQYVMAGVEVEKDVMHLCFGNRYAPGGYAWVIPTGGDTANVGVGVRKPYLDKGTSIRDCLETFLRDHPLVEQMMECAKPIAIQSGAIPAGGAPASTVGDGMIIAGDAAGHVMSTSGGGITLAMIAGRAAGETAVRHVTSGIPLEEYEAIWRGEMGPELETGAAMRRAMDRAMRSDRIINTILHLLQPEHMDAIVRGQMPDTLKRLLTAYA